MQFTRHKKKTVEAPETQGKDISLLMSDLNSTMELTLPLCLFFIWAIIAKEILPELVSGQERINECFIMIIKKAEKELKNLGKQKR